MLSYNFFFREAISCQVYLSAMYFSYTNCELSGLHSKTNKKKKE